MKIRRAYLWLGLGLFGLCVLYVRLWNLEWNPLWYTDETNYIRLAEDLSGRWLHTQAAHKALLAPFGTDAVPHPPLYFRIVGTLYDLFGRSIYPGRVFSGLLAIVSAVFLYSAVSRIWGKAPGFLAAGLLSFHLPSVLFLRWGMPYNLGMAFSVVAFWALAKGLDEGKKPPHSPLPRLPDRGDFWLIAACALAGLSAGSVFFGLGPLAFASAICVWRLRRRPLWLAAALIAGWAPMAWFVAVGVAGRGGAFLHDFGALGMRAGAGGDAGAALRTLGAQLWRTLTRDPVYFAGIAGLLWGAHRRAKRWPLLYFAMSLGLPLVKRGGDPYAKYDEVMFLFLIYAGAGALLAEAACLVPKVYKRAPKGLGYTLAWILSCVVLLCMGVQRIYQVSTAIPSQFEAVGSARSIGAARALAKWLDERAGPEDLIVAPERMDFLIERPRVTNLYQAVARKWGDTTWHHNLTEDRWRFDPDFDKARYVIVDATDLTIVLAENNPHMMEARAELLDARKWRRAAVMGEYVVFERVR